MACAPKVAPNDAEREICSLTTIDDDLVERQAAVLLCRVGAHDAQRAAALDQLSRERPVLLFEPVEHGQHFVLHEVADRVADHPVLLGPLFRSEDAGRVGRLEQELAATQDRSCCRHDYIRSNMPAAPMPPPTHMVTMPYLPLRRRSS